ncbi:MAG: hypothetical protein BWY77_00133 [bacterium ADurb.Bin431]|nr:MAG: hypothetical protein BWY77_00133 [bacterium ADurb.Bin431]
MQLFDLRRCILCILAAHFDQGFGFNDLPVQSIALPPHRLEFALHPGHGHIQLASPAGGAVDGLFDGLDLLAQGRRPLGALVPLRLQVAGAQILQLEVVAELAHFTDDALSLTLTLLTCLSEGLLLKGLPP